LKKVQVLIERVVADAYRAAEIIDRTRSMASRGRTTKTDIALNQVVAESMMFLQHEVQLRNVAVSLDLVSNLPIVIGDRTQLQQVIVNLALNAIQALTASAESERALLVRTCQSDAVTICCIVEDSGPGIDSEHLPQLFDSFFTTKETGMGLGLPIARSIIEAHNGQISADNQSSLGGARFVIELPVGSLPGG
jgi:C4-dicarboxylate-specific signal transduction histidine kinase